MEDAQDASGWVFKLATIFWVESPTEQPQGPRVILKRHTWAISIYFYQNIGEEIQQSGTIIPFPKPQHPLSLKFAN